MKFWEQPKQVRQTIRRKYNRLRMEITILKERESQLANQLAFATHERESREKELKTTLDNYPDVDKIPT